MKVLSVLLPVLSPRDDDFFIKIKKSIDDQTRDYSSIEVIHLKNNGELSIGEYRNELLRMSSGEYSWFLDADDRISDDAVCRVMACINLYSPCAIGITVDRFVDGKFVGQAIHSDKHDGDSHRAAGPGRYEFIKIINHICVVKTEIARQIGFKPLKVGEDCDYARRLKASGLLKKVVVLGPPAIYFYDYRSKK